MTVKLADCCRHCKNTANEYCFRDGVLCHKSNTYQFYTNVCEEFEMKEG